MLVRLALPRGGHQSAHTHPCGHGMYVPKEPGGRTREHTARGVSYGSPGRGNDGARRADGDVTAVFITNKPFRIDYL
jgi:hypothetical protein